MDCERVRRHSGHRLLAVILGYEPDFIPKSILRALKFVYKPLVEDSGSFLDFGHRYLDESYVFDIPSPLGF